MSLIHFVMFQEICAQFQVQIICCHRVSQSPYHSTEPFNASLKHAKQLQKIPEWFEIAVIFFS